MMMITLNIIRTKVAERWRTTEREFYAGHYNILITYIVFIYNYIQLYLYINSPSQSQGGQTSTNWSLETSSSKRPGEWALVKISAG